MPLTAREAAMKALGAWRRSGVWSDGDLRALCDKNGLDARDAALASRICLTTIQNLYLCDAHIARASSIKLGRIEPVVLDILRLSACQILFMSRIPHRAAVSAGTDLARKYANKRASGFVNAVLRRVSESREAMPEIPGDAADRLSVIYSHPLWLVRRFIGLLGEDGAARALAANNAPCPTFIQINTLKCDGISTISTKLGKNYEFTPHKWLEGCFEIQSFSGLAGTGTFKEGLMYVQDPAAKMAVIASGVKPGDTVVDVCAAPGGKSFAAACLMGGSGRIISCDINPGKLSKISDGAKRLGIDILEVRQADARDHIEEFVSATDVVIADVPCSGLGVIRKKPDIRYKTAEEISGLPELQLEILKNVSGYVRPDGVLMYSTCTVLPEENERVIEAFLASCVDFRVEPFDLPGIGETAGMVTLWPHIHGTDGFFMCRLRRLSDEEGH